MKKILLIAGILMTLFTGTLFSQNKCSAPIPFLANVTNQSALIAWQPIPEALSYQVVIYKSGSSIPLQTLETVNPFVNIIGLQAGGTYTATVNSRCSSGSSEKRIISFQCLISVEDNIVFRLVKDPFTTTECSSVMKNPQCFNAFTSTQDLMRYGGEFFTLSDQNGHSYKWRSTINGSDLTFRSSQSSLSGIGNVRIEFIAPYVINFRDIQRGHILWTMIESRSANRQPSFILLFKEAACLSIERCDIQTVNPKDLKDVCLETPSLCNNLEGERPQNDNKFSVSPNPVTNMANVSLTISKTTDATVNVYDLSGKLIETLHSGIIENGIHKFAWQSPQILRGVYFIELKTPTSRIVQKIVKL
jgi:hypothetical protein